MHIQGTVLLKLLIDLEVQPVECQNHVCRRRWLESELSQQDFISIAQAQTQTFLLLFKHITCSSYLIEQDLHDP